MTTSRLALTMACLVLACHPARDVASAADRVDVGMLTLTGTIRMPDGSPASDAIVESAGDPDDGPTVARADRAGRFRLRGVFGIGIRLHARSADGLHQATRIIPAVVARSIAANPIDLTLAPAVGHEVIVRAGDRPVEGAHVAASGPSFRVQGVTGPDGKLSLRIPATERLDEVSAWHRRSGVAGVRDLDKIPPKGRTELSLLPPAPLWVRAIDPDGHPVPSPELGLSFLAEGHEWAVLDSIAAARVRTGDDGTIIIPWAPREKLVAVDPRELSPDWKIDGVDLEPTGDRVRDRILTIHLRRLRPVEGRLVMPDGSSPQSLLVTGFGFGPRNNGAIPYARVRPDGSFTPRIASDHGYGLGVSDLEWASEPWTGLILGKDSDKPAPVTIPVRRATPVMVRVTRGPARTPVAGAWVEVGNRMEFRWTDSGGKSRSGRAGLRSWLTTDADGRVRTGAGRGKLEVRIADGEWDEERTVVVSSDEPIEVEFHRPWLGRRQVAGRLLIDGRPFRPSPSLVARAWTPRPPIVPDEIKPEVHSVGTFKAVFDAENLLLFFSDPERRRSGFAAVGLNESSVDVNMLAMAADRGTALDRDGRPMAGQTLRLLLKDAGLEPVATQETDASGRFRFPAVPARTPLVLVIGDGRRRMESFVAHNERMFEPGEVRDNDMLDIRRLERQAGVARPVQPARPEVPLAGRIDEACRNVRPVGMRALVVLRGGDAGDAATSNLIDRWLDGERSPVIWSYLPVQVDPEELKAEAATLGKYGWAAPASGEVELIAMDGNGETIATERIRAEPPAEALDRGDAFLKRHRPKPRDARAGLATARDEARRTGRRVWVVHGGPRCVPCFRLGRWIEEHHAALEKDFVLFKVMDGIDEHAAEVINGLPESPGDGIPWHAFTEPDGTILATSHGPLGNIGCPSGVEDLRHFRRMLDLAARRLSAAERDALIASLAEKK